MPVLHNGEAGGIYVTVNQPHLPTPAVTPARYALDESLDKVDKPPLDTMPKLVREVSTTLAQRAQDQQG
jgi:hypothetical protein